MRLMKSGTSSATNLDIFISRRVRIIRNDSLLHEPNTSFFFSVVMLSGGDEAWRSAEPF